MMELKKFTNRHPFMTILIIFSIIYITATTIVCFQDPHAFAETMDDIVSLWILAGIAYVLVCL